MASKFVQLTENERLCSHQTIKFSIYMIMAPEAFRFRSRFCCFMHHIFPVMRILLIYAMQLVTPSAVAMADSTLMAVWIVNFQKVLFFMVIMF